MEVLFCNGSLLMCPHGLVLSLVLILFHGQNKSFLIGSQLPAGFGGLEES